MRYIPFLAIVVLAAVCLGLGVWLSAAWLWPLALLGPLVLIGVWDLCQPGHTLMRLYPVSAHFRWFCEWLRPYMREYLLDSDHPGRPYTHKQRALVYRRAQEGVKIGRASGRESVGQSEWIAVGDRT